MATEKRLIDANALIEKIKFEHDCVMQDPEVGNPTKWRESVCYQRSMRAIEKAPIIGAVVLPCKIGDRAWAIRCYRGVKHPQEGIVNEMFFNEQMELCIVVKNIARGIWGKAVFGSYEDAQAAISRERKYNG